MQIIQQKIFHPLGLVILGLACLFIASTIQVSANVSLQSFTATASSAKIQLQWKTASETNSNTFNVMRAESQTGPFTKIISKSGCPGGCITGGTYDYDDTTVVAGKKYYYKVEAVSSSGTQTSSVVQAQLNAPTSTPQATATKTATPQPTATKTNTLVPGAPTFTPAPTDTPQPAPTATNTLVPGAPTYTPMPPSQQTLAAAIARATATAQRIAVAKPGSTPSANVPPSAANNSSAPAAPSVVAVAPIGEDEPADEDEFFDQDQPSAPRFAIPWRGLMTIGAVLASGTLGLLGVGLLGLAAFIFVRARMR